MQFRSAVSLLLGIVALGCVGAVLGIAFAHGIALPFSQVEIRSLAGPLLGLFATGVLFAANQRHALREALERAGSETAASRDERVAVRIVLALVVTGFLLRLARIGEYGLSPDEGQLVWYSAPETLAGVWAFVMESTAPPTFHLLFHYMLMVSWEPFWLRIPAVISGTYLIWISYRFGRELLGTPAGVAMAWLVAFSPPLFELSRVARNYTPGFALIVLSLFFFVRFLKTGRWRDFAWYSLIAPFAVTWHYVFFLAFASMKVVLAAELLRQRRPLSWWVRAAVYQLPFAALMLFLYVEHIAKMSDQLVTYHLEVYDWMLAFDPDRPLRPLEEVWMLLAPGGTKSILFFLSALGALVLAVNRNWLPLLVCCVPIVVVHAAAWAGEVPLGRTRHSVYIFPFLFGLVVCHVPELLTGYRETGRNLLRLFVRGEPGGRALDGGGAASLAGPVLGVAAACSIAALFMFSSLLESNHEMARNPFSVHTYHGRELVREYRQADVEHAFELLEEYVGPNDWVLLGEASAYALRMRLEEPAVPFPTREERAGRDICLVAGADQGVYRRRHNGVQYFLSKGTIGVNEISDAMRMLRHVRKYFGLKSPDKVWFMRSAWSAAPIRAFEDVEPSIRIDRRADRESRGMIFGIETRQLRALARATR